MKLYILASLSFWLLGTAFGNLDKISLYKEKDANDCFSTYQWTRQIESPIFPVQSYLRFNFNTHSKTFRVFGVELFVKAFPFNALNKESLENTFSLFLKEWQLTNVNLSDLAVVDCDSDFILNNVDFKQGPGNCFYFNSLAFNSKGEVIKALVSHPPFKFLMNTLMTTWNPHVVLDNEVIKEVSFYFDHFHLPSSENPNSAAAEIRWRIQSHFSNDMFIKNEKELAGSCPENTECNFSALPEPFFDEIKSKLGEIFSSSAAGVLKGQPQATFSRSQTGQGLHRLLKTKITLENMAEDLESCAVQLVETLPNGIYIDIHEIQMINKRKWSFQNFEKIDIEKPAFFSPQHVVTLEQSISLDENPKQEMLFEIDIPIHLRYQAPGYSIKYDTKFIHPYVYFKCIAKSQTTQSFLFRFGSSEDQNWLSLSFPIAQIRDKPMVDIITLIVVLACSIVFIQSLIRHSLNQEKCKT